MLGIFDAHSKHGLLLDTNLLVVRVWGELGMPQTRVTDAYTAEDLRLLLALLARNRGPLLTTAHILAETSNLVAGALTGDMRRAALIYLRTLVLDVLDETPISGRQAVEDPVFLELGMADAGIAVLRSRKCVVLTADGPLYQRLAALQVPVLNFNHCRGYLLS